MRNGIFVFFIFCLALSKSLFADSAKFVNEGNKLYKAEEYDSALEQYKKAEEISPESAIIKFDMGAALYKTKNYEEAVPAFVKSLASEDALMEEAANYNIGNAKYRIGVAKEKDNPENAINTWKESLKYYKRAIEINPDDEDAKFNYEYVEKKLEQLKKEEPKQDQKQDQQENQDQEQNQDQQKNQDQEQNQDQEKNEDEDKKNEDQEQKDQQKDKEEEQKDKDKEQEQKEQEQKEQEQKEQEQKEQEQKEQEQEQKEQEQKEQQEQQQEQPSGQSQSQAPQRDFHGGMSEEEAEMLLEGHQHEEEETGEEMQVRGRSGDEVLKDW